MFSQLNFLEYYASSGNLPCCEEVSRAKRCPGSLHTEPFEKYRVRLGPFLQLLARYQMSAKKDAP